MTLSFYHNALGIQGDKNLLSYFNTICTELLIYIFVVCHLGCCNILDLPFLSLVLNFKQNGLVDTNKQAQTATFIHT